MSEPIRYIRHTFVGYSGYLVHPDCTQHELLAVRHSDSVPSWTDPDVHLHHTAEEYYLLLRGKLWFLVAETTIILKPYEILMVKPDVPHAIARGEGLIEHFGFRAPTPNDRQSLAAVSTLLPPATNEAQRELVQDWGYRIPLNEAHNRNCWLIGLGAARFHSPHFLFAYLDFPTYEAANDGIGTRHRLHLHKESWEYYVVLTGTKTLLVEEEEITIQPGEMLDIFPGVKHTLSGRQAPYRGFTFRVPLLNDKVEY